MKKEICYLIHKRTVIFIIFFTFSSLSPKAFSLGGNKKSSLLKSITKLQSEQAISYLNLRKIIDKMIENDLLTTSDQYYFLMFQKFVEIFNTYNVNEKKIDLLMKKFSSDLVKYSEMLILGVDKIGVRTHHNFCETYFFSSEEVQLFEKIYEKFPYNQSFLSTIVYIKNYRLKSERTPSSVPEPPTGIPSLFSLEQSPMAQVTNR